MASNPSPGVYSKITDLSSYVQAIPGTIAFIPALTKKGEDNTLKFISSRAELVSEFGEPNITEYGKNYGQGLYCAYNYLGESGALYFMRAMPDDAAFANLQINGSFSGTDATAAITVSYVASTSANSTSEFKTALVQTGTTYPLCVLRPIGRGEYYNALGIRIVTHSNPLLDGVYVLDIYERQSDGSDVIIESFEISFDPTAVDSSGDSIFIENILASYSSVLRAEVELASGAYTEGYDQLVRIYDQNIGNVTVTGTDGTGVVTLTDNKQDFEDWETTSGTVYAYCVVAIDAKGNKRYGWLGAASGDDNVTVSIYDNRVIANGSAGWITASGDTSTFDESGDVTYTIKKFYTEISEAFTSSEPLPLRKGSDGSFISSGNFSQSDGKQALVQAYAGTLNSPVDGTDVADVLDTENVYFSLVFDCGYPSDVKSQISSLVQTRKDCVAILDNGDNASYTLADSTRTDTHTFNNYYCALYEPYNKVYDQFTGQDIWVSPVYHMAYLLPRNDNVADLWWAAAGFDRASIDSIKELRYNARQGQRDQFYLSQINPIVKFNEGYTPWGQLTTQSKASALQDLNIVRLVLYIQRALSEYCRAFIYQQNDAITWSSVSGDIIAFLENIKQARGLYSYSVTVGATAYELKSKTFHVDIILEPTRTVEKIELNFFVK